MCIWSTPGGAASNASRRRACQRIAVEGATPNSVVVDGRDYPLDCLIFATGFEVGTGYARRVGFETYGRDGLSLSEKWRDGARTLHSFYSRGFPNCFLVSVTQAGQSANLTHIIDEQSKHIAYVIGEARRRGARTIEPAADAEDAWVEEIVQAANGRQNYLAECTPGYYNIEGNLNEVTARNSQYWRGPVAFLRLLDRWREDGTMTGLELTYGDAAGSTDRI